MYFHTSFDHRCACNEIGDDQAYLHVFLFGSSPFILEVCSCLFCNNAPVKFHCFALNVIGPLAIVLNYKEGNSMLSFVLKFVNFLLCLV